MRFDQLPLGIFHCAVLHNLAAASSYSGKNFTLDQRFYRSTFHPRQMAMRCFPGQ